MSRFTDKPIADSSSGADFATAGRNASQPQFPVCVAHLNRLDGVAA
ncbi:hypothetical protein G7047_05505 [Diaphorobacter sp. HDW4A]|nr:hypothetical protein [Diaphorobacter sp. HDW4A]QIL79421.1 hypothetical protein G7047_05505 [Diaphorobacter sp. HDW4A]